MSTLTNDYKDKVVYRALEELDDELYQRGIAAPIDMKVIGGFALLLENIRLKDYTDIDYIGDEFDRDIQALIDRIGIKYKLGRGWINRDVMYADYCEEDMEFSTGKLEFHHVDDLKVFRLYALNLDCLLRMKVIALDTSFAEIDFNGDFTRAKDLPDVKMLADKLEMSYNDVVMATQEFVIFPKVYFLIKNYFKYGDISILDNKEKMHAVINSKGNKRIE